MSEEENMFSAKSLEELLGDNTKLLDKHLRPLEGGEIEKVKKLATSDTDYGKNDSDEETIHVEDDCPIGSDCDRELHPERPEYTGEKEPKQLSSDIVQTGVCEPHCTGGQITILRMKTMDGQPVNEAVCGSCKHSLGRSDTIASLRARVDSLKAHFEEQNSIDEPFTWPLEEGQLAGKTLEEVLDTPAPGLYVMPSGPLEPKAGDGFVWEEDA